MLCCWQQNFFQIIFWIGKNRCFSFATLPYAFPNFTPIYALISNEGHINCSLRNLTQVPYFPSKLFQYWKFRNQSFVDVSPEFINSKRDAWMTTLPWLWRHHYKVWSKGFWKYIFALNSRNFSKEIFQEVYCPNFYALKVFVLIVCIFYHS